MNPTHVIPGALLFVAAIVFIIRANFIFFRILDEVNANRPDSQQISFLFVSLRFGCWEFTGNYNGDKLTYVVWVAP
jgi:hypothetical protein